jgi:hypothetical protein
MHGRHKRDVAAEARSSFAERVFTSTGGRPRGDSSGTPWAAVAQGWPPGEGCPTSGRRCWRRWPARSSSASASASAGASRIARARRGQLDRGPERRRLRDLQPMRSAAAADRLPANPPQEAFARSRSRPGKLRPTGSHERSHGGAGMSRGQHDGALRAPSRSPGQSLAPAQRQERRSRHLPVKSTRWPAT